MPPSWETATASDTIPSTSAWIFSSSALSLNFSSPYLTTTFFCSGVIRLALIWSAAPSASSPPTSTSPIRTPSAIRWS